jgi:hypothetical protein
LAKNHDLLPRFVNGRDTELIPAEINNNSVRFSVGRKSYCFPIDRDLPVSDPEKSAKVDNGRANLSGFVSNNVDDPAHVIASGAANLFAENALDLLTI